MQALGYSKYKQREKKGKEINTLYPPSVEIKVFIRRGIELDKGTLFTLRQI